MIYVPGADPDGPPKIVAALVPKDDPIMRRMRDEWDPDHIEVRYFATMRLSDGRTDTREWGQGLESFAWAWGPVRWVCPD